VFQDGWMKTISPTSRTQQLALPHSTNLSHRQNFVLSRGRASRQRAPSLAGRVIILRPDQRRAVGLNQPEGRHQPPDFLRRSERMLTRHHLSKPRRKPRPNKQQHDWFPALPCKQFQVLFNSLFKVLFIFPSRYLFAIGLSSVFSFR